MTSGCRTSGSSRPNTPSSCPSRSRAQLLELGEAADDPLARAAGLTAWAIQCWHRGRIAEGLEVINRAAAAGAAPGAAAASEDMAAEGHALVAGFQVIFHLFAGDAADARTAPLEEAATVAAAQGAHGVARRARAQLEELAAQA